MTVWGNTYQSNLSSLITLQKKAVRIINFSSFNEHSSPLFKGLHLLKFTDIVYYNTALFMHNFYNGNLPKSFDGFFNPVYQLHGHNTRLASKLAYSLPMARTNYGIFNIRFTGPRIWNDIDDSLKNLSIFSFKRKLKYRLINRY